MISSGSDAKGLNGWLGDWVGESKRSDMTSGNVKMIKEHIIIDYQAVRFGWALHGPRPATLIDARPAAQRRFEKRARPVKLNLIGSELLFKYSFSRRHIECNNTRSLQTKPILYHSTFFTQLFPLVWSFFLSQFNRCFY